MEINKEKKTKKSSFKDIELYSFDKNYNALTLDFKKTNEELYDLGMLVPYFCVREPGFKVTKHFKTTKKGTTFRFNKLKDKEDVDAYQQIVLEKVADFMNKYGDSPVSDIIKKFLDELELEKKLG